MILGTVYFIIAIFGYLAFN